MGDDINLLITLYNGGNLVRCALQFKRDRLPQDCIDYPLEPGHRKQIGALLPLHVQTFGQIVEVDRIFDIHIADG